MGLRLTTDERMHEMENEIESWKRGYDRMIKEHDKMLKSYRDMRDSKDAEIDRLHAEIEALKNERAENRKENKRLRDAVQYYERRKRDESRKTAV